LYLRGLFFAFLAILLSQIIFWPTVHLAEHLARPSQMAELPYVEMTQFAENGSVLKNGEKVKAHYHGTDGYVVRPWPETSKVVFDLSFETSNSREPIAIYLSYAESINEIKINGQTIFADLPFSRQPGAISYQPAIYPIPFEALKNGENIVHVTRSIDGYITAMPEFAIGPAAELYAIYHLRMLLNVDLPLVGIAVLLFTFLLCWVVNWQKEDVPRVRALMALLLACAFSNFALTFLPTSNLPFEGVVMIFGGLNLLIAFISLQYVSFDTGLLQSINKPLRLLVYAIPFLLLPWFVFAQLPFADKGSTYRLMIDLTHILFAGFVGFAIIILALSLHGVNWGRRFERFILILCLTTFAFDRIGSVIDIQSFFDPGTSFSLSWSPLVGMLFGLVMLVSLARQAGEARETVAKANQILAQRLADQEKTIAKAFEKNREVEHKNALLEERQRILRDLHDGFGSQLFGLSVQVRNDKLDKIGIENVLANSLIDLRLMVDSLDSVGESLDLALVSFRDRITPMLASSGVGLEWRNRLSFAAPAYGPQIVLHCFRILQEATSNAVRHSNCKRIVITIDVDGAVPPNLIISIADDGEGFGQNIIEGKGLANMRNRAALCGGRLETQSNNKGSKITLILPPIGPKS
jgi:signal transduction histidine kinase